jgi:hypothetical protein
MRPAIKTGVVVGNGAAINVELGWIPTFVQLFNATDGDLVTTAFLSPYVVNFTGGGTVEVVGGSTIRGVTSLATAKVTSVTLYSGTWAAGDAAGFMTLEEGSVVGTFTAGGEDLVVTNPASGSVTTAAGGDATVPSGGVSAGHNYSNNSAALATATTTSAMSRYEGSAPANSKGFTIGSVIAEEAKALRFLAVRDDS